MSFCAVLFPRGVLDENLNLIESVSEGFPSYSFILKEKTRRQIDVVLIPSNCQTSVGILQLCWENKTHKKTSLGIIQIMKDLQQSGTEVKIQWTPGHADIAGNETAATLAKEAVREAEDMPEGDEETSQADMNKGPDKQ